MKVKGSTVSHYIRKVECSSLRATSYFFFNLFLSNPKTNSFFALKWQFICIYYKYIVVILEHTYSRMLSQATLIGSFVQLFNQSIIWQPHNANHHADTDQKLQVLFTWDIRIQKPWSLWLWPLIASARQTGLGFSETLMGTKVARVYTELCKKKKKEKLQYSKQLCGRSILLKGVLEGQTGLSWQESYSNLISYLYNCFGNFKMHDELESNGLRQQKTIQLRWQLSDAICGPGLKKTKLVCTLWKEGVAYSPHQFQPFMGVC